MPRCTPSISDARTSVASWTLRTATLAVILTYLATSILAAPVKPAQRKRKNQLSLDSASLIMMEAVTWSRYDRHVLRYKEPLQIFWAAEVTRAQERSGKRFASPPCLSRAIERDQAYASLELNEHGQKICVVPLAPPRPRLQRIEQPTSDKIETTSTPIGQAQAGVSLDRRPSPAKIVTLASKTLTSETWIQGSCKDTAAKFNVSEDDCVQVSVVRDSCRSKLWQRIFRIERDEFVLELPRRQI
ncbi:BQ2448_6873 [Microbotryum intermedium]|uniref:BQ2448_6873 protein n=1 Tax=Microbotryum intermedium TaxID=269621 RepID=A0A238FP18_9BASI|nr:BQ2448_6873 [Microbotryum intermedium]